MNKRSRSFVGLSLSIFLACLSLGTASATSFTVDGNGADQQVGANGTLQWVGQTSFRCGYNSDGQSVVLVFALPHIGTETISTANLKLNLEAVNLWGAVMNADLYGLRSSTSPNVLSSDYFSGIYDSDGTATALQDDLLSPSTSTGTINSDATGDANLATWLQSLYDSGAQAGDYAFIRISADRHPGSTYRYFRISSAEAGGAKPVLTFDTGGGPSETFPVEGDAADQQVGANGILQWVGQTSFRSGFNVDGQSVVLVFSLPELSGGIISSADINFNLEAANFWGSVMNADLYGIRSSTSASVLGSDYFTGAYNTDASATALQDDILTPSSPLGSISSDATGNANLSTWLQSLYDGGAQAGDFAFIRVSGDRSPGATYRYFRLTSADSGANKPLLTITTGSGSGGGGTSGDIIWVDGNTSGGSPDGSSSNPYPTIQAGLNAAVAGKVVTVRAGTYHEAVQLPGGGTATDPITLTSETGARVIVSGMEEISGWQTHSGNIQKTTTNWEAEQLFVGFNRQTLAREPNQGYWAATAVNSDAGGGNATLTDTINLSGFSKNLSGASILVWTTWGNNFYRCPIVSIDASSGTITFTKCVASMVLSVGDKYSVENQVSLVDQMGEWAIATAGTNYTMYLLPTSSGDLNNTQSPKTTPRIMLSNNKAHLRIKGLEIAGSSANGLEIQGADDVEVTDCIFHDNIFDGLKLNNCDNVQVLRNIFLNNRFGIEVTNTRDSTLKNNEVGYSGEDGVRIINSSQNINFIDNYLHHHFGALGHPDHLQFWGNVDNVIVRGNLMMSAFQSVMSQEFTNGLFENNAIVGAGAMGMIFGHGNSGMHNVYNNTLAYARYSPLRFDWKDYDIDENICMSGNNEFIYNTDEGSNYIGNRNLFYNSDRITGSTKVLVSPGPIFNQTFAAYQSNAAGQDAQSSYGNPQFVNAPITVTIIDVNALTTATTTSLPLVSYHEVQVGDKIEVNFDGVVRTVSNVSGNIVTFSPALNEKPLRDYLVSVWGSNSNFTWNLSLSAGSPGLVLGAGGGQVGSTLSVADFQAGDFDGDGNRDLPTLPIDID